MVERLRGPAFVPDKQRKRDALRAAFVADKELAREQAPWRNSDFKSRVEASRSSAAVGAEAAISARVPGQELSGEDGVAHADLVRDAKVEELDAWKSFKAVKPARAGNAGKTAVGTRYALA